MKITRIVLLSLFHFILLSVCQSQGKIVNDGKYPESEIHAAINPTNSDNIVVGVMGISTFFELVIYVSMDKGLSWTKSDYNGISSNYTQAADPVLSFDMNGNVYLSHLGMRKSDEIVETVLAKSTDGGITWTSQVVNVDTDKPWLWIDKSNSSSFKNFKYISYLTSNITLSKYDTTDMLQQPSTRVSTSEDQKNNFSVLTTNKQGDLFVCYNSKETHSNQIYISNSKDGGKTFLSENIIVPLKLNIYDGEKIPGFEEKIYNCPNIAIDYSNGKYSNIMYFSYTDEEHDQLANDPTSTLLDVFICYSDDDGKTWSTPIPVHKNLLGSQQFYSTLAVNEKGQVIVTWYDQRDPVGSGITNYYMAISNDGGDHFIEKKLSSSSSDFNKIGLSNGNFSIGEYTSTVVTGDLAFAFWADGRTNDGDINVYYSIVDIKNFETAVPEIFLLAEKVKISIHSQNQVTNAIKLNIEANQTLDVLCQFINVSGKILDSKRMTFVEGKQIIEISIPLVVEGEIFLRFIDESNKALLKTIPLIK